MNFLPRKKPQTHTHSFHKLFTTSNPPMDITGNHMLWTELSSPKIPMLKLHPPLWLFEDSKK